MGGWPPAVEASGDHYCRVVCGDRIDDATHERVRHAFAALEAAGLEGVENLHPAYATVGVSFDPRRVTVETMREAIAAALRETVTFELPPHRLIGIPVAYGGEWGPDLANVARHVGITREEVVARHSGATYRVHFLGFSPGFPYLGGLPPELATPRLPTPRPRVPAGSVAIGGAQTGVYPQATPGGWRIIGRTPLALFDPYRPSPALLTLGDRVAFRPLPPGGGVEIEPARPAPSALAGAPVAEVLRPGLLTTVQDLGRPGLAHMGVARGGAADPVSLRAANLCVGNPEGAAALEITLSGCALRLLRDAVVAVAGADVPLHVDGRPVPAWQPVAVQAGGVLEVGAAMEGARTYLAVRGGLAVPLMMGSASTHLAAAFGGVEGRSLRAGDLLRAWPVPGASARRARAVEPALRALLTRAESLRVLPGAHAGALGGRALAALSGATFAVSARSDRTGVRLTGDPIGTAAGTLLTEGVPTGAVQVPPDGQPIVMLADHPTTGGYPQLATVIAADLHRLGQLRPGRLVRFEIVDDATAAAALAELEQVVSTLAPGGRA
ncbi:MAG: 5-oxoprolinase subunit PxpB [Thermoanaerobaculaceae bacterium]